MRHKIIITLCLLSLAGCSSTKETLGLTKKAPDEFQVLKRAPLAMPPDYALRPPEPGAPRPQEQETARQAAQAVFGETRNSDTETPSNSAALLLQQAGADKADPSVRATLDAETKELAETSKSVVRKILDLGGGESQAPASVVDAPKEAQRLKKNTESGKPVTEGETPTVTEE